MQLRHTRLENTGRRKAGEGVPCLRRLRAAPCSSPPPLILHPCPIPVISLHTSVKTPKDGTLPKGTGQTYGKNAHSGRQRIGQASDRGRAGDRLGSASEIRLPCVLPWSAVRQAGLIHARSEHNANPVEVQTKLRSHSGGYPVRRRSVACPLTTRDWFEYGNTLVRPLLATASAFSRSVVEQVSNNCRPIINSVN